MGNLLQFMRGIIAAAAFATLIPTASVAADAAGGITADKVAVVIGNRAYRNPRVPAVEYAGRDADAFDRYLKEVLGFREGNIIDLRDAGQADMEAALGNSRNAQGRLWQLVKPGKSEVVVYYSGHGAPGLQDHKGYLMPSDADPEKPEINGYPIDVLLQNLSRLEARSVVVYLDACFSGDTPKGSLLRSASPIVIAAKESIAPAGITMLTAGHADQIASWDDKSRHGLFTEHLLDALYGKADRAPYGNGDGKVSAKEAKAYLDEIMTYAARREFGRTQNASLIGDEDKTLSTLPAGKPVVRIDPPVQTVTPQLSLPPVAPPVVVPHPVAVTAPKKAPEQFRPATTSVAPRQESGELWVPIHDPPPDAYEACRGKVAGDPARRRTPEGMVPATCVPTAAGLVARPIRPPEGAGSPERRIPKQALDDCAGRMAGDVVQHRTPNGFVPAACVESPEGLAARPLRFPSEATAQSPPPPPAPPPAPAPTYRPASSPESVYFSSESAARQSCQGDVVVWVNTDTLVYHYPGRRWYGRTKDGAFMCERSRSLVGARPSGNNQ